MSSDQKKDFEWSKGQVLNDDNSKPLGGVRVAALKEKKINQAVLAEPEARVQARKQYLDEVQSQEYREQVQERRQQSQKPEEPALIIEESHSGVSADYEPSEVKKIGDDADKEKEHQFQGIGRRFGKPPPPSKKE